MNEKELKNREKVVMELNMAFDEATELFSEESLNTMRMEKVVGGNGEISPNSINIIGCVNSQCDNCNICINKKNCPKHEAICILASIELPTVPPVTLDPPTLAS